MAKKAIVHPTLKLVPDYPTLKPPFISLSACWLGLDKLESIVEKLEFIEDEEILFEWIQTIKVNLYCPSRTGS